MAFEQNPEMYAMLQVGRQRKCRTHIDELKTISAYGMSAADEYDDEEYAEQWADLHAILLEASEQLNLMEVTHDEAFGGGG